MKTRLFACAATVLIAACDSRTPIPEVIAHPVVDSLESSHADAPVIRISFASSDSVPEEYRSLVLFPSEGTTGVLDGPPESVFGSIVDAVVLTSGEIALLDAQAGLLRVLDPKSGQLRSHGGFGKAPGELSEPVSVFEASSGRPAVIDAEGRKIQEFSTSGLPHPPSTPLPLYPQDACEINGRLFVLGPLLIADSAGMLAMKSRALVHEIDGTGVLVRSFSTPYRYSNFILSYTYGVGRLACDSNADGQLWAAFSVLGEVHSLNLDGRTKWIAKLNDLKFPKQIEEGNRVGSEPNSLVRELITNILLISPTVLAVQVQSRERPDSNTRTWDLKYRTYLLDAGTGQFVGSFAANHEIIGAGVGTAVLYRSDPFPLAAIVRTGKQ
ncbi:MAG TPA: hypothetical protein VMN60_09705 [Longimicrobiales bacterium]|nr:hypothetical protein [Longimicrobiales bacterium]